MLFKKSPLQNKLPDLQQNTAMRHPAFVSLMSLIITINLVYAFLVPYVSANLAVTHQQDIILQLLAARCIMNIVCMVALYNFKRWGFYGYTVSAIATIVGQYHFNISIIPWTQTVALYLFLFFSLQLGDQRKMWNFLK